MSQADGNSTEGESSKGPVVGCYSNYDHYSSRQRRSDSFQPGAACLGDPPPPPPPPPPTQPLLLDLPATDAEEPPDSECQPLTRSPGGFASLDLKVFMDAESLMPRPTSDLRSPVCLELRALRASYAVDVPGRAQPIMAPGNGGGDLGSVASSDTYASCNTHPFHSQGDLTSDIAEPGCALDSNLYVNPLDGPRSGSVVKKSASGDTGLRSLGASPLEEGFKGFRELGSRGSLNEPPLPKHRKTRFQQGVKPRTRFGEPERVLADSQESLEAKKTFRKSFMQGKSLASATRLINQHLFGLQNLSGSRSGKIGGSKTSLSVDSIDSRTSPTLDTHRRSKSILKKSDTSSLHQQHLRNGRSAGDPETEKLISDHTTGATCTSGSEYSPSKLQCCPLSPLPTTRQPPRSTAAKLAAVPAHYTWGFRPPHLLALDDLLGGEKHSRDEAVVENRHKELLEAEGGCRPVPADGGCCMGSALYMCPTAPGTADEHSPTEETKLLLQQSTLAGTPAGTAVRLHRHKEHSAS